MVIRCCCFGFGWVCGCLLIVGDLIAGCCFDLMRFGFGGCWLIWLCVLICCLFSVFLLVVCFRGIWRLAAGLYLWVLALRVVVVGGWCVFLSFG